MVSFIDLSCEDDKEKLRKRGILIQTKTSIFFLGLQHGVLEPLINEPFKVNLNMIRGIHNKFYFALRDESAASDALNVIKFSMSKEENEDGTEKELCLNWHSLAVNYPGSGEILALESDNFQ